MTVAVDVIVAGSPEGTLIDERLTPANLALEVQTLAPELNVTVITADSPPPPSPPPLRCPDQDCACLVGRNNARRPDDSLLSAPKWCYQIDLTDPSIGERDCENFYAMDPEAPYTFRLCVPV